MSKNITACLSHNSDDWKTPSDLYKAFMDKGFKDCFPFHSEKDEYNNLYVDSKLFINPPYSHLRKPFFTEWLLDQIDNKIALLVPARTDTEWFEVLSSFCSYVVFIKGRLKFNDSKSAPFPFMLMIFGYTVCPFRFLVIPKSDLIEFVNECL